MKLQIKAIMTLVVIFTVLFIILTTVTRSIILTSFQELENKSVERNIHRAVSMFYHEFDSLRKLSYDWSAWDDTYTFVENRNQVYIDANLQDVAFQGIGINIMTSFLEKSTTHKTKMIHRYLRSCYKSSPKLNMQRYYITTPRPAIFKESFLSPIIFYLLPLDQFSPVQKKDLSMEH
jgi:hypothetical protein